jgi:hypothetical protein
MKNKLRKLAVHLISLPRQYVIHQINIRRSTDMRNTIASIINQLASIDDKRKYDFKNSKSDKILNAKIDSYR